MKIGKLRYLVISRYLTYLFGYIACIIRISNNTKDVFIYTMLFLFILINSSIRIYKVKDKKYPFIFTVIIEALVIFFMSINYDYISEIYLCILMVDIFLFFKIKEGMAISLPIFLSVLASEIYCAAPGRLKYALTDFLSISLGIIFFAAAAALVRKTTLMNDEMVLLNADLKEKKEELQRANEKLKDYSQKVQEIAILNERNRLAGEIHDTIGHSLTALIMELEICTKLINKDVDKTKTELKKAEELGRYSLSEVRKSVRAIKSSNVLTGTSAIKELISDFEKTSGVKVSFEISRQQFNLSPAIEVTIYKAIQESLTNCAKYGHAKNVNIILTYKKDEVELSINNDGTNCKDIKMGVGLRTMKERTEALGGKISISSENGFSILIDIPVEENYE